MCSGVLFLESSDKVDAPIGIMVPGLVEGLNEYVVVSTGSTTTTV